MLVGWVGGTQTVPKYGGALIVGLAAGAVRWWWLGGGGGGGGRRTTCQLQSDSRPAHCSLYCSPHNRQVRGKQMGI